MTHIEGNWQIGEKKKKPRVKRFRVHFRLQFPFVGLWV